MNWPNQWSNPRSTSQKTITLTITPLHGRVCYISYMSPITNRTWLYIVNISFLSCQLLLMPETSITCKFNIVVHLLATSCSTITFLKVFNISRFNLLPHRHFYYLSLIESLFDSYLANMRASVHDKLCDIQEQRVVVHIVLHTQLIQSISCK